MKDTEKKSRISAVVWITVAIVGVVMLAGLIATIVSSLSATKEGVYGSEIHSETPKENFTYEITDENVRIISFNSEESTVAIPYKIDGKKVGYINKGAFMENYSLQKVLIADGVEKIGEKAFYRCKNLQYAYIPESVSEIGADAFEGCGDRFTVYGAENSYAQEYCQKHSIQFEIDK